MKKIASQVSVLLVLCAATLLAAPAAAPPAGKNPGYRIGPRDLLEIKVYELSELNGERRVSEEGTISLPLVGDYKVAGKTDLEIAQELKELLEKKYVQRASVDIQIKEFRSRPIAVIGAVKQPGNLGFSGRWTLLEALAAAGGLAENHGNVLYVLRRAESGLSDQVAIDLDDLLVRADPHVNIPIYANDLINVPATVEVTVYCLGEVGRPGALTFKSTERLTLLAAIARAGGLSDRASRKILIKRGGKNAGQQELVIDYRRIIAGKQADPELGQGDVVVVKESFF
ncbi:MAG: polysaccharide biosynthesis/export family protein [Acidobacteriota bacterium]|nr:polysaccharide biosynthesis/export family protein [Acidobacteriota bacterium]